MTWPQGTARPNDTDTVRELHSVGVGSVDSVARCHWHERRSVYTHCDAIAVAP